jgi:dTDP-glucose 4,6-dehydratase
VSGRRVVVLGGGSFSGQDLIDLLVEDGHDVVAVGRSPEPGPPFLSPRLAASRTRYRYRQLDLNRDWADVLALLDDVRPSWVVNFAAQGQVAPSWESPEEWLETNAVALARVANHLRRRGYLERFLQVSTPEVYGTCAGVVTETAPLAPSTPYAASKAAADLLLATYRKEFGLPVCTVRFASFRAR